PMVPGGLDGERQLLRAGVRQGAGRYPEERLVPGRLARERQLLHPLRAAVMNLTTKIRFTEPQIALVMGAHPNCNLDGLSEICFEFDRTGKIIDCIGTIKDGGDIDHDYTGSGLARLYERARRRLTATRTNPTLAELLMPLPAANPFSTMRASLRWYSSEELEDGVTYGGQSWLRRGSVDSFFSALLLRDGDAAGRRKRSSS